MIRRLFIGPLEQIQPGFSESFKADKKGSSRDAAVFYSLISMGGAVAAIAAAREPYIYKKSNLVFSDDPSSDGKCPLSCCNQNFPGSLQNRERNEVCSRPEAI